MKLLKSLSLTLSVSIALLNANLASADNVSKYCVRDAHIFCSHIKSNKGRIGQCLSKHRTEISRACRAVVETVTHIIKKEFIRVCGANAQQFCNRTRPGKGRIMRCLQRNYDHLSNSCSSLTTKLTGYTPQSLDDL